jgi:hypothetical protein
LVRPNRNLMRLGEGFGGWSRGFPELGKILRTFAVAGPYFPGSKLWKI